MKNNSHYTLCTTDLMMGLLFIFIILLVGFMIKIKEASSNNWSRKPFEERKILLEELSHQMQNQNIQVEVDHKTGVLRLRDFYYFKKGDYELSKKGKESFKKIRKIFSALICYSDFKNEETQKRIHSICEHNKNSYNCQNKLSQWQQKCDKKNKYGLLDTVLIEGHADSTPIGGNLEWEKKNIESNLELAMHRSLNVFEFLLNYQEQTREVPESGNHLYTLINKNKKPLFGLSSFGNLRRNINNRQPSSQTQKKDRRIDFRFIMSQPEDLKKYLKKSDKKLNMEQTGS